MNWVKFISRSLIYFLPEPRGMRKVVCSLRRVKIQGLVYS